MNNQNNHAEAHEQKAKRVQRKALPKRKILVQKVGGIDRPFLICVILLLCIGTVMVFSSSYPYAKEYMEGDSYHFVKKQLVFAVAGVFAMSFIANVVDYHFLRKISKGLFVIGLVMLVLVLVVGDGAKGAVRWLPIIPGVISIQPSEIMKFAVVLLFADYADKYTHKITARDNLYDNRYRLIPGAVLALAGVISFVLIQNVAVAAIVAIVFVGGAGYFLFRVNFKNELPGFFYGVLPYIAVLGVVGVLMVMQPHLSGLIIIACIIFFMMIIGCTKWYYLMCGVVGGVAGVLALAFGMSHSSARLAVWKDPFSYLLEGGWQPAQSLYAIGSGGLTGVGFGNSRQKHLYLPEPQNDYIFSIWCEEMGFIGALFLICVFVFFIYRGIVIGLRAPDRFSSMLVIGIIMHVGLQAILNIAVVSNTLPSTGISLPFFSYGGSSLIILMAEMGVVMSISRMSGVEKT